MRKKQLMEDKKAILAYIQRSHALCDTMMLKKFGRFVDFEKLEDIGIHPELEGLKESMLLANEANTREAVIADVRMRRSCVKIITIISETHELT